MEKEILHIFKCGGYIMLSWESVENSTYILLDIGKSGYGGVPSLYGW